MARAIWVPWVASVVLTGLTASIVGYCLGTARATPSPVVAPAPVVVAPEPDPVRGDQGRFCASDPGAARRKADPGREWWLRAEIPAGVPGGVVEITAAIPVGIEVREIQPGVAEWGTWTRSEHRRCQLVCRPTGRTSADMEPLDLALLSGRSRDIIGLNFGDAIRMAQRFNAGDLVEVRFRDHRGLERTLWAPHEALLERPRDP